jgi:hypothetical protein
MPVELDAAGGKVRVGDRTYSFPRLPREIIAICEAGGLLEFTRRKLAAVKAGA